MKRKVMVLAAAAIAALAFTASSLASAAPNPGCGQFAAIHCSFR